MDDRSTLVTFLALTLRRMNELALSDGTGMSQVELERFRRESHRLQELVEKCMRMIRHSTDQSTTNS